MNTLERTTSPFHAVICLNGNIPGERVLSELAQYPLIAADGATEKLHAMGVVAEYVVGDFDSIPQWYLKEYASVCEFVHDPSQDTNDFEKALVFAQSMLWKRILVIGIHGGDLEHTLNNWSVFMRFGTQMQLVALDQDRYAVPLYANTRYAAEPEELLSLIPQPSAVVTTKGLTWPLNAEELSLGRREGARNRANAQEVEIEIHSGSVLFFCNAELPMAPEFR